MWVAVVEGKISRLEGKKSIAIVMNASTFSEATEVDQRSAAGKGSSSELGSDACEPRSVVLRRSTADYFLTNVEPNPVTPQWVVKTYSQRNWVEVFYREAKGNLGLREYQVRDKRSLLRHFILVFCGYTFIIWHQLTGGLRRIWSNRPLNTFSEALEAFRTAITYRFLKWIQENWDVFVA